MLALLILIIGGLAAFGLTMAAIYYAKRHGLMDFPGERSSHTETTPRGGGISVVIVTIVGGGILAWLGDLDWSLFQGLILSLLLVTGIGYLDDHKHVPPIIRFIVHLFAAGLVIYYLNGFPFTPIFGMEFDLGLAGYALGILLLAWFLNLYNFMDGTDGIAACEAIFISIGMIILIFLADAEDSAHNQISNSLMSLYLLVAAGSFGFLLFNFPPAKIFMGDVGSGFLGFFLGSVGLTSVAFG
ncbi:MAG: hypothetical protein KAV87_05220, partial [Desulfobacteraceae bacterium]|nr:hypothetical protein [Desulfobacteraceae bacterium]